MSMEMRVFFAGDVPPPGDVQATMAKLGLGFRFANSVRPLDAGRGYRPMTVSVDDKTIETGVEIYTGPSADIIQDADITGIPTNLDREVSFRWGGDFLEMAAALALSAAIAELTNGVIFDDESGEVMDVSITCNAARSSIGYALKERR